MSDDYKGPRLLMPDEYKKPYLILFNGVTDALELIRKGCRAEAEACLLQAQASAEEVYIQGGE